MKATQVVKISPIVELTSPTLLQCRDGECGTCPNGTGKLLWFPNDIGLGSGKNFPILNLRYDFFNKSEESTSEIKYNIVDSSSSPAASYGVPPTKLFATNNQPTIYIPSLSPSLMKFPNMVTASFQVDNGWLFFRQQNPAIGNVHDALCFEYNHEKRLITFRSF